MVVMKQYVIIMRNIINKRIKGALAQWNIRLRKVVRTTGKF
jgi:hypothetical protein